MKKLMIMLILFSMVIFSACGVDRTDSKITDEETVAQGEDMLQKNTEEKGKIKAIVSENCNYIYHMLSVSRCGYDNEYGRKYQSFHSQEDLQTLKKYETYITVSGGEHSGELYFFCVALPASLDDDISVPTYFEALIDLFESENLEQNLEKYQDIYEQSFVTMGITVNLASLGEFHDNAEPYKKEITEISKVMYNNYRIYDEKVWETSKTELSAFAEELNQQLNKIDYIGKWEEVLDCNYKYDDFLAVLCNSIADGPSCIDISANKDVFYYSGSAASTAQLISHEFGIYLLKDLLSDTKAFQDFAYYELVEGLAEYYNIEVSGGYAGWEPGSAYIEFYQQLKEKEPEITAEAMFLRAVDYYIPDVASEHVM